MRHSASAPTKSVSPQMSTSQTAYRRSGRAWRPLLLPFPFPFPLPLPLALPSPLPPRPPECLPRPPPEGAASISMSTTALSSTSWSSASRSVATLTDSAGAWPAAVATSTAASFGLRLLASGQVSMQTTSRMVKPLGILQSVYRSRRTPFLRRTSTRPSFESKRHRSPSGLTSTSQFADRSSGTSTIQSGTCSCLAKKMVRCRRRSRRNFLARSRRCADVKTMSTSSTTSESSSIIASPSTASSSTSSSNSTCCSKSLASLSPRSASMAMRRTSLMRLLRASLCCAFNAARLRSASASRLLFGLNCS
mmetsp:Transcript_37726/g.66341  ORF Transcript_37726/g.66341 Transcript_37726/m.66341 type:complete len:307 (+) Transcript_37726:728-1648(+)